MTSAPHSTAGANRLEVTTPATAGRRIVVWLLGLAALTGVGVLLAHAAGAEPGEEVPAAALLVGLAPTLAALGVAAAFGRGRGAWALLRKVGTWRAGWRWYGLVLLVPVGLVLCTNLLYGASGGPVPSTWIALPTAAAVGVAVGPWLAGMIEEIGWRGFAQPLLQVRFSALWASVIIGVVWATWHEWPLLAPGGWEDFSALGLATGYLRLIATAILYGWLYNTTRSLLLVIVAHLAHNVALELVPLPADAGAGWALIFALLYAALAALVVWLTNPRTLTRDRRANG